METDRTTIAWNDIVKNVLSFIGIGHRKIEITRKVREKLNNEKVTELKHI